MTPIIPPKMQSYMERYHDNHQFHLSGGLNGALFFSPFNPLSPNPATPNPPPKKQFPISNGAVQTTGGVVATGGIIAGKMVSDGIITGAAAKTVTGLNAVGAIASMTVFAALQWYGFAEYDKSLDELQSTYDDLASRLDQQYSKLSQINAAINNSQGCPCKQT